MKVLFDTNFEDAIIATTAQSETAEYIITRNIKDFTQSPVPALTPSDFLRKFNSGF